MIHFTSLLFLLRPDIDNYMVFWKYLSIELFDYVFKIRLLYFEFLLASDPQLQRLHKICKVNVHGLIQYYIWVSSLGEMYTIIILSGALLSL